MSGTEEQDDKMDRSTDNVDQRAAGAEDVELDEAIKSFKQSVDAWSDAAYGRPRTVEQTVRRRSWRLAVGWALGCVLVAGSVSGGLFERQHQIELKQRANRERAAELGAKSLCFQLPQGFDDEATAMAVVEGAILASYRFDRYKEPPASDAERSRALEELIISAPSDLTAALARAQVVAEAANAARTLQDTPSNDMPRGSLRRSSTRSPSKSRAGTRSPPAAWARSRRSPGAATRSRR